MEMETTPPAFEQLPLARADMITATSGHYRVYTDRKNFTLVEADSAVHALENSGLIAAFKIEREALHRSTLIMPNFAKTEGAETAMSAVPAETLSASTLN